MLSYINERNVERMIDAKNAEITRKINGDYTLSFIAIDEPDLLEELIVICEGQKYRIKQLSSTMSGNKTLQSVTCKHISFDLIDYYAYDYLTNTVTLDKALQFLFKDTPFTYSISDSIKNQSFEKLGECNKQKLLAKIIEAYGLEYEVDNYHFTFKKKVGYETEFQFRYKANISSVKKDIDTTSLTTYIKGYGKKDDDGNYLCTAEYTSPNAEKFGVRHADPVFDERFTIKSELLEYIKTKINDTPDIVVELDYTQIDSTQPINLGDYGYLIHEPLQLDLLSRVIEITKKLSTDRQGNNYQNMTYKIGSQKLVKSSFETSKDSITGNLETPKVEIPDVIIPDIDYDRIQAEIEAGKQEATDKINSGLGGYVTKTRNELLIMDTEDKATARNLWRWNINGLGFSSNGYSGPYATAITNDGKINADRILVGTIDGALIRANTIKANSLEISTVQKINSAITADDATAIMNTRLEVYDGNIKTHISTVAESKKTEAINSSNQNTTSAINSAKTELNQNINTAKSDLTSKINLKANASDVYGKSEVYTKTQTDSAIKQSKDNISLEVSNKYETKTDAAAKITNLSIGGVNLYLNTKIINRSDWANIGNWNTSETYNEFTVFSRTGAWMGLYQNIRYEVGQTYTLSAYVKGTNGAKLHFYLNGSGSTIATSFNGGDTISDSWTRVWATFRVNGSDFGKPRFENPTDGATLKIYGFKLEKGNKATDWSPAPEDVDSLIDTAAINAINSANQNTATVIANYYTKSETDSKISVAKDEINLGVSNTYETRTNVETKVSSTLNSAKSYADTKKTEAINAASTDAANKANNAKNEAIASANSTLTTTIANYYTKEETNSQINIAKEAINLGVSQTYETKAEVTNKINDAIGDVQVGGTNLAIGTNRGDWGWTWAIQTNGGNTKTSEYIDGVDCVKFVKDENDGSGWHFLCYDFFARDKIIPSTEYTLSFEIKSSLDINFYTATLMHQNASESLIKNTRFINGSVKANDENWTKIVAVMTTHDTLPTTTDQVIYLGGLDINANSTYYIRNLQLEKGNRATEWSYAVEDIDNNINDAKQEAITSANNTLTTTIANYYTKEETNSQINIAKNEINLGVSSTYETKTNVETKINAIQVGGANLWSETAWVDGAVMGDGTLSDYWTRPHVSYPDFVSVGNNEYITYQCWNPNGIVNDTNYNRIAFYNSDRAVLGSVDVPKLSGEPYQCMTWEILSGTKYIRFGVISDVGYGGYNTSLKFKFELGNKPTEWSPNALDITNNITTAKNDAIASANNTLNTTIANYYTKSETDSQINIAKDNITSSVSSLRTDIMNTSFTNLLLNSDFQYYQNGVNMPTHYGSTNLAYCYGGGWLCPEGGKTIHINTVGSGRDWQGWTSHFIKASKDQVMTASVYVATDNLNSFNSNLGLEIEWVNSNYERIICSGLYFNMQNSHTWERKSITGTAPEGTAYVRIYCWHHLEGVSWWGKPMLQMGSVCTAWDKGGSIDVVEQRLSSAEQKITDTAITNTVKQNFYTKQETENAITSKGYATQSQVQQTAENIQFKFTQTGGYNLIRNGNPKPHNYRHWWVSSNANWYLGSAADIGVQTTDTNEAYAGCATFKVQPGTNYSVSCWLMAETNTKGTDVYFIGSANDDGAYTEVHHLYNGSGDGNWVNVKATFTTGPNINYGFIRIDNNGIINANQGWNVVFFSEVQMVKGWECYPQWSPNPNEVYDGITTIDKDGIKVSTNKGAYTHFSSDGMNSYDNDGNMTLGLRNGGMTFHAWNNHEYVGYISQTASRSTDNNGVCLGMTPLGDYISFGVSSNATDPNSGFSQTSYFVIAPHDNYDNNTLGLNAYKHLNMHGWDITNGGTFTAGVFYSKNGMKFKGNSPIYFDGDATYPSAIWEDTGDGMVRFYGDNGIIMGYRNGNTNEQCFYIKETRDGLSCRIGMYDHLNMNGWRIKNATVNNCSFRLDEYQRTTADYVSIFKYSNSSKSEMNIELANDYVTWFNIQANNYVDKGKYIACFNYQNGTAASNVGIHFYRAVNAHGYNITNVGNMSVYSVRSEELEVNDIRVSTPFAVMSRSGEQTSLSVTKSIDDLTEANGTVTISNKQAKVELPQGLIFTDYYVQVTGNKIANLAVTERTDEYFMIETDSEEEIEVFYTIKAFQPKYVTRTSVYGELQGEDGTVSATYEEAMAEERARTAQLLSDEEGSKPADLSKPAEPVEIVRDSFHT